MQTDLMVDTIGNILSVAGVLMTLVAYRMVRLHELEPRLAALWRGGVTVLRRRLGPQGQRDGPADLGELRLCLFSR